jgi:hypothetical protein
MPVYQELTRLRIGGKRGDQELVCARNAQNRVVWREGQITPELTLRPPSGATARASMHNLQQTLAGALAARA